MKRKAINAQNMIHLTANLFCTAVMRGRLQRTNYCAGMVDGQKIALAGILQFSLPSQPKSFQREIGAYIRERLNIGAAK